MSEVLTKVRGKVVNLGMKTKTGLMAVAMSTACAVPAFAAESGHISHTQLRLRPAAAALAGLPYFRRTHRPVLFPFP